MKTFKEHVKDLQEVNMPLSQGEANFFKMHNPIDHKNLVPGVTDQEHLFKGLPRREDPSSASYENFRDDDESKEAYDKGLQASEEYPEQDRDVTEATLSAKAARAGKDIGKPGKNFSKIAKSAAKKYGSEEAGKKVAGAILAKMRAVKEALDPVGKEDEDVDNDGKKNTKTDQYLKNRRKAISKAIKEDAINEKHLTPAEMKKREEVAKALKRENPGMPMAKKMAIATATAKKVAEEVVDEAMRSDIIKKASKDAAERSADPRTKPGAAPAWLNKAIKKNVKKSVKEEVEAVDEGTANAGKWSPAHTRSKNALRAKQASAKYAGTMSPNSNLSFPKHKIELTVSDKDGEGGTKKIMHVIQAKDKHSAMTQAQFAHAKKFKILDTKHKGMVKEEVEQVEEAKDQQYVRSVSPTGSVTHTKVHATKAFALLNQMRKQGHKASIVSGKTAPVKEDVELDEAKRGRPRKGTSPSGDDQDQEANQNIHTQLHKVISANKPVTFNNGKSHQISSAHAHKALSMLQNSKASERLAIQNSLAHSHDRFHETLKQGKAIVDAPRPKVSLAKSVREDADVASVRSDRGNIKTFYRIGNDGRVKLEKHRESRKEIKIGEALEITSDNVKSAAATQYAKGQESKVNMQQDSLNKLQADPLASKNGKEALPPTQGNKPIGGESEPSRVGGKFSMEEETLLNKLYEALSDENKVMFDQMKGTEDGVKSLLNFARELGI